MRIHLFHIYLYLYNILIFYISIYTHTLSNYVRKPVHLNHVNVFPFSHPGASPLGSSGVPHTGTQLSQGAVGTEKSLPNAIPCGPGGRLKPWLGLCCPPVVPRGGSKAPSRDPRLPPAPGSLQNSPRTRPAGPWRWQVGSPHVPLPLPAGCSRKGTEL